MILPEKLDAKALITGASGFIGSRLRDALLEAGCDVVAIRRQSSPEPKRGRSVVADYADVEQLERIVGDEKPDFLFHVAGTTNGVTYEDFERANVMPTRNLLKAFEKGHPDVRRYLLVSSLAAFGPSEPDVPHNESTTPRPIEHYGESKLDAERVLEAESDKVKWSVIRPGGVYGPGEYEIFTLFKEATKGRNIFFGNEHKWWSAVYVDDCVRAIVSCAQSEASVGKGYFICDGDPVTWGRFQNLVVAEAGRKVRTVKLPGFLVKAAALGGELVTKIDGKPRLFNRNKAKMDAQAAWTCQHDAARADFGYRPQVPVDEGVRLAFAWYRENGWL